MKTAEQLIAAACRDANVTRTNIGGDTEALSLLFRALVEFRRDFGSQDATQDLTDSTTPALTSGTQEYALADDLDSIVKVLARSSATAAWGELPQGSHMMRFEYLDSGTPVAWYLRRPSGGMMLGLVPAPDATVAGAYEYKIVYTAKPTAPTATTDELDLTSEEAEIVTLELAAMMAERVGEDQTAARLRAQAKRTRGKAAETPLSLGAMTLSHPFGDLLLPGATLAAGEGLTERGY